MTLLIFLGALSLSVLAFEIASNLRGGLVRRSRLLGIQTSATLTLPRRSAWHALLGAVWPARFDPAAATNMADVVELLRRAGYPYETPGAFYAASVRIFSLFLAVGGLLAGLLFSMGMGIAGIGLAAIFVFLGLRRPYAQLKFLAQRRAGGHAQQYVDRPGDAELAAGCRRGCTGGAAACRWGGWPVLQPAGIADRPHGSR